MTRNNPGALISEQTVTTRRRGIATQTDPDDLVRFEADLNTPVPLSTGWISIRGFGDNDCFFYWYKSDQGDGTHRRQVDGGGFNFTGGDFSFLPAGVHAARAWRG